MWKTALKIAKIQPKVAIYEREIRESRRNTDDLSGQLLLWPYAHAGTHEVQTLSPSPPMSGSDIQGSCVPRPYAEAPCLCGACSLQVVQTSDARFQHFGGYSGYRAFQLPSPHPQPKEGGGGGGLHGAPPTRFATDIVTISRRHWRTIAELRISIATP